MAEMRESVRLDLIDGVSEVLRKIERNTNETTRKMERDSAQLSKAFEGVKRSLLAWGAGLVTVEALRRSLSYVVTEAANAERQTAKLAQALKNVGAAGELSRVQEFARSLQSATGVSDETTKSMVALGVTMGVSVNQAMRLSRAAADMGAVAGNTEQKFQMLVKAAQGQTDSLRELGFQTKTASGAAKDFETILGEIEQKFSGQAKQNLDTFNGQLTLMKNNFSDIAEAAGTPLLTPLNQFLAWINKAIERQALLNAEIKDFNKQTTIQALVATEREINDKFGYGLEDDATMARQLEYDRLMKRRSDLQTRLTVTLPEEAKAARNVKEDWAKSDAQRTAEAQAQKAAADAAAIAAQRFFTEMQSDYDWDAVAAEFADAHMRAQQRFAERQNIQEMQAEDIIGYGAGERAYNESMERMAYQHRLQPGMGYGDEMVADFYGRSGTSSPELQEITNALTDFFGYENDYAYIKRKADKQLADAATEAAQALDQTANAAYQTGAMYGQLAGALVSGDFGGALFAAGGIVGGDYGAGLMTAGSIVSGAQNLRPEQGALMGAAQGAAFGTMVGGPYGAVVGGVVGGTLGLVSSDSGPRTQGGKRREELRDIIKDTLGPRSLRYGDVGGYGDSYANLSEYLVGEAGGTGEMLAGLRDTVEAQLGRNLSLAEEADLISTLISKTKDLTDAQADQIAAMAILSSTDILSAEDFGGNLDLLRQGTLRQREMDRLKGVESSAYEQYIATGSEADKQAAMAARENRRNLELADRAEREKWKNEIADSLRAEGMSEADIQNYFTENQSIEENTRDSAKYLRMIAEKLGADVSTTSTVTVDPNSGVTTSTTTTHIDSDGGDPLLDSLPTRYGRRGMGGGGRVVINVNGAVGSKVEVARWVQDGLNAARRQRKIRRAS